MHQLHAGGSSLAFPVVDYLPGHVTEKWPGGTRVNIISET